MLSAMRSSRSNLFVWIIILLLIVGLAGFGISQSGGSNSGVAVANVGEEEVTVNDFGQAYQNEMRQMAQTFGRQVTQQEMQLFGGDQRVLQRLLSLAALDGEAKRMEISVGDGVVIDRLKETQAFHGLTGGFDPETYELLLERSGISPTDYENSLRDDASRQIVTAAIVGGVQIGETLPATIVKFIAEKRGVSYVKLTQEALTAPISDPSASDLDAYFEANKENYRRPETRDVTYVELREGDFLDSVDVAEEEIRAEYDARADEFTQKAMVSLDRIVFGSLDEAVATLGRIGAGAADFDAVAQERGLQPTDIELGEVTANELSADARGPVFSAKEPGVLGPYQSELGPALYRINAVIPGNEKSYEEVRDALRTEIATELAAEELANSADEIDDLIAGGASLEEVADATAMKLSSLVFDPTVTQGISADAGFRREVLDAEVGEDRDLQDLGDDGLFALRLEGITEPMIPALADIKDAVTADWRKAKTLEALQFRAEDLQKRISNGEELATLAEELSLDVQTPEAVQRNQPVEGAPGELTALLFEGTNGDAVVVDDGTDSFLAVVGDLMPANLDDPSNKSALERITQTLQAGVAEDMLNYFATGIQDREGVSVNQGMVQSVLTQIHNF